MNARWSAALLALAITVLPACDRTTPEEKAQEKAVRPYLDVLAGDVTAIPSVTCVLAVLPTDGVPGGSQSDITAVDVQVELPLGDPASTRCSSRSASSCGAHPCPCPRWTSPPSAAVCASARTAQAAPSALTP